MGSYRAKDQSTLDRKEDDEEKITSRMLGIIELLRNPRNRLYLATLVLVTLFLIPFNFYVSQFSIFGQFIIGVLCGLFIQGVYFLYCLHRAHQRRRKSVQIAQLATLDRDRLKVLLLAKELFPTWIAFTDFEKTDWLNRILNKFWPYITDKVAEVFIKESVQPILNEYAFGIIQKITLESIRFGDKAPQITGVRFSPGLEDESILEIKFNWQAEKDRVILLFDFPGPNYRVKLKSWHLNGTAKLILKPLTSTIPGFGAVLVSFTEVVSIISHYMASQYASFVGVVITLHPDFDFMLKFLGENFATFPGVGKLIDHAIRTALMDSLIWPSRIVVPMIPGDFSFLELHPVGELEVTLIEAKMFRNAGHVWKANPFVVLYVRHTENKTKRSKSRHHTLKPAWNEVFRIEVEDPEYQKLTLRLMDDKSVGIAESIGKAELPIKEFKALEKTDHWCNVLDSALEFKSYFRSKRWRDEWEDPGSPSVSSPQDRILGSLHVIVTWYPYTREQILEKRGSINETEKMLYEEQKTMAAEKIFGPHK